MEKFLGMRKLEGGHVMRALKGEKFPKHSNI